jgi:hypothetical protein
MWHEKSSFVRTGTGIQSILNFCLRNLSGCNVGPTDGRDLKCSVEMGSGNTMKNSACVQAILSFGLSNLKACNVGITDGRDS